MLYFDKYLLDIQQNENNSLLNRWKSPAERTLYELKNPDPNSGDDIKNLQAFRAELTLRYAMPLNIIGFSILVMFVTISFAYTRKENISKTLLVFLTIILLQIISIVSSNLSIKFSNYEIINFFPIIFSLSTLLFFIPRSKKL